MRSAIWVMVAVVIGSANAENSASSKQEPLLIAGVHGESIRRDFEVSGKVQDAKLIPSTFTRSDSRSLSSRDIVQMQPGPDSADGRSLPLTFNFSSAPSGEYSGALRFATSGGELTIPVVLKIKDPRPWPLACLIFGLAVSSLMTWYATQGRPRDRLLLREASVRSEYGKDPDRQHPLAAIFIEKCEGALVESDARRANAKWKEAEEAMDRAEAVWHKWGESRSDWRALWAFNDVLKQHLGKQGAAPFAAAIRNKLDIFAREATSGTPGDYRTRLSEIQQEVQRYDRLLRSRTDLQALWDGLQDDERDTKHVQVQRLSRRVDDYDPTDAHAYEKLLQELDAAIEELERLPRRKHVTRESADQRNAGRLSDGVLPQLQPAAPPRGAQWRLGAFGLFAWLVALALLSGAGFQELYESKVTFGSQPWLDYFGLLAWGFGAEATRASVMTALRSVGIG